MDRVPDSELASVEVMHVFGGMILFVKFFDEIPASIRGKEPYLKN